MAADANSSVAKANSRALFTAIKPLVLRSLGGDASLSANEICVVAHQAAALCPSYVETARYTRLALVDRTGRTDWCVVVGRDVSSASRTAGRATAYLSVPALAADLLGAARKNGIEPTTSSEAAGFYAAAVKNRAFAFSILVYRVMSDANAEAAAMSGSGAEPTAVAVSTPADAPVAGAGSSSSSSSAGPTRPLGLGVVRKEMVPVAVVPSRRPPSSEEAMLAIIARLQRSHGLNAGVDVKFVETLRNTLCSTFNGTWHVLLATNPCHVRNANNERATTMEELQHRPAFDVAFATADAVRAADAAIGAVQPTTAAPSAAAGKPGKGGKKKAGSGAAADRDHAGPVEVSLLDITLACHYADGQSAEPVVAAKTPTQYSLCVFKTTAEALAQVQLQSSATSGSALTSLPLLGQLMSPFKTASSSSIRAMCYLIAAIAAAGWAYLSYWFDNDCGVHVTGADAARVFPATILFLLSAVPPPLPRWKGIAAHLPQGAVNQVWWLADAVPTAASDALSSVMDVAGGVPAAAEFDPTSAAAAAATDALAADALPTVVDGTLLPPGCPPVAASAAQLRLAQAQGLLYIAFAALVVLSVVRIGSKAFNKSHMSTILRNMKSTRVEEAQSMMAAAEQAKKNAAGAGVRKRK